ncbi:hypothetical protein HN51_044283, partial [Arachis hypogaea]
KTVNRTGQCNQKACEADRSVQSEKLIEPDRPVQPENLIIGPIDSTRKAVMRICRFN